VSRRVKVLAVVVVVAVAVVLAFRTFGDDDSRTPAGDTTPAADRGLPPPYPDDMPAEGMYVDSTLTDDGQVEVRTWVRSATPLSELTLTTTDPDLAPGGVESIDVHVRTLEGRNLARRDSVGTNPQRLRLNQPTEELYFSYTIDGGLSDSAETVANRGLVRVLGMDVSYADQAGSVRRVVHAPGTVINVACLRPKATQDEDFDAAPRPCGAATDDGGWAVDLKGANLGDRLLAQVEG
jgi:hypothetical protein